MIFKYSELRRFLRHIKQIYLITSLDKWDGSNAIILRHDVDFNIESAYKLALIEKEIGITSTFFIMTTAHTYNPMSIKNRKMLVEMVKLGFEIGLHFDSSVYGNINIDKMKNKVDEEASVLFSIINKKIVSISLHNPSVNGKYLIFEGYNNAYDKKIFSPKIYLSDSIMKFRHNIYEFVKRVKTTHIQILLHPLHYTKNGGNYATIMSEFINTFTKDIESIHAVNKTFNEQVKEGILSHMFGGKK